MYLPEERTSERDSSRHARRSRECTARGVTAFGVAEERLAFVLNANELLHWVEGTHLWKKVPELRFYN